MHGDAIGQAPLRMVWVIEGGRSHTDVVALRAVARALTEAGVQVKLVRHGLGRLSTLQVQRAVREAQPDVLISTGVTSTRHLRRLAMRLGCPLVCYYWPSAALLDVHRHSRSKTASRDDARLSGGPQRAVLGSQWQRDELLTLLRRGGGRSPLPASRLHVLPALFDDALFGPDLTDHASVQPGNAPAHGEPPAGFQLGVFGALPAGLAEQAAPFVIVPLDGGPAHRTQPTRGAAHLRACTGVLIVVHDSHEAQEAARHCQLALILGKPVLLCGFGKPGDEVPGELAALSLPTTILRTAKPADLPTALRSFCQALPALSAAAKTGHSVADEPALLAHLRQTLRPAHVLAEHVALLFEIAAEGAASRAAPSLGQRARALGLRLWRRPPLLALHYPRVVSELRGRDLAALITLESLERQLQTLLRAGYKPQPLSAVGPGAARKLRSPRNFVVIFDGEHPDANNLAAPLLARLGIPFAVLSSDAEIPQKRIRLSELSSLGRRGAFDAHRFWLQIAQSA